jgi:uncharacterized delta-60 repeat protein
VEKPNLTRTIVLAGGLLAQLCALPYPAPAVVGDADLSFNATLDTNSAVFVVAVQPDGRMIIGGEFTNIQGFQRSNIARLNVDGSVDIDFNPGLGANGSVCSIACQPDGKILIAGSFTAVDNTNRQGVARLNDNGSLDGGFTVGTGATGTGGYPHVNTIALQNDGKVIAVGDFGAFNGVGRKSVVRLYSNGNVDSNFIPATNIEENYNSVLVQPDGKILVAGYYRYYDGQIFESYKLLRLNTNGTADNSFQQLVGPTVQNFMAFTALARQADGKVLVSETTSERFLIRCNVNGSSDSSFIPHSTGGYGPIALQPDGKILLGDGLGVVRLNTNGSPDSSFQSVASDVRAIVRQPDGNVVICGSFEMVNGVPRRGIARIYGDSPGPSLNITRSNTFAIVSWPVTALSFQLQENTNLSVPNSWSLVAQFPVTNAGQISVTVPTTVGRKFFRLRSQ